MRRIILLLLVFGSAVLAPAQAVTADQTGFEKGLKAAEDAAKRGSHKAAREQFQALLKAHEGQDYVFAHRGELEALARNCAFHLTHPDPDPKTLVAGELLSWNAASGHLKIRYEVGKPTDFKQGNNWAVHPAKFAGPYSVQVKGRAYPSGTSVDVLVCSDADVCSVVAFGMAAENNGTTQHWIPAQLVSYVGKTEEKLDKKEQSPCRPEKPYTVIVKVTDSEVLGLYNGRQILSGRKPKGIWGWVGVDGKRAEEIILEGKAEPAWIQGLIDEKQQNARTEFEATYQPRSELPEWLYERSGKVTAADRKAASAAAKEAIRLLRASDLDGAKRCVDAALAKVPGTPDLVELQAMIIKAATGPLWRERFEWKSQNFEVFSDIDKKTCEEASKILEDAYLAYSVYLERVPDAGARRFRVYLFSGQAGYEAFSQDILQTIPKHTAGLYSPFLKVLLIRNLPGRDEMMCTVRHEGFHQYVDRLVPDPPTWFNEGLAEYYETARMVDGTWKVGEMRPDHLETLARSDLPDLTEFVREKPASFYDHARERYAEAWAFVTFLRHSSPENKAFFQSLWTELRAAPTGAPVIEKLFTPAVTRRLQLEWKEWCAARAK